MPIPTPLASAAGVDKPRQETDRQPLLFWLAKPPQEEGPSGGLGGSPQQVRGVVRDQCFHSPPREICPRGSVKPFRDPCRVLLSVTPCANPAKGIGENNQTSLQ